MSNYQCVNFVTCRRRVHPAAQVRGHGGRRSAGFLAFMEELVKVIKAKGGDVRTGCRVKRISVTDEGVNGVW